MYFNMFQGQLDSGSAAGLIGTLQRSAASLKKSSKFAKFLIELINKYTDAVSIHTTFTHICNVWMDVTVIFPTHLGCNCLDMTDSRLLSLKYVLMELILQQDWSLC